MSSIESFRLKPSDIRFVGANLSRPECILAEADGTLWISDDRAAVTRLDADGRQTLILDGKVARDFQTPKVEFIPAMQTIPNPEPPPAGGDLIKGLSPAGPDNVPGPKAESQAVRGYDGSLVRDPTRSNR